MRTDILKYCVLASIFILTACVGGPCTYKEPVPHNIKITALEAASDGNYLKIFYEKSGKVDYLAENYSKILSTSEIEKIKADLNSKGLYPGAELVLTEEVIKTGTCTPVIYGIYTKNGGIRLY